MTASTPSCVKVVTNNPKVVPPSLVTVYGNVCHQSRYDSVSFGAHQSERKTSDLERRRRVGGMLLGRLKSPQSRMLNNFRKRTADGGALV